MDQRAAGLIIPRLCVKGAWHIGCDDLPRPTTRTFSAFAAKMPSAGDVVYYFFHIRELSAIIQWKTWHKSVHVRVESKESRDLKECYRFLDLTSRSFVAVVQELHPELLVPVCIFYLILRSLDTVEDDMAISIEEKEPLLRDFYTHIDDKNWT